jgi:hypothetical protein
VENDKSIWWGNYYRRRAVGKVGKVILVLNYLIKHYAITAYGGAEV